jgi:hypothetical protein
MELTQLGDVLMASLPAVANIPVVTPVRWLEDP